MSCIRCKMVVKSELEKLGFPEATVELGEAVINKPFLREELETLNTALKKNGYELLNDKKSILVERIKTMIIEMIHYSDVEIKINISHLLSEKLHHNYTYLSNLFSIVTGSTIEKFYVTHKIERVKELLVYDELTITEIADNLHYSSVAHLSNQFKKVTGLTPSQFKNLRHKRRHCMRICRQ
jgi:AraC-like DNA-binding protein